MDNPGLLSQSEIDALLSAISNEENATETTAPAEAPNDKAKRYDFRRPDRFSKDQMRALRLVHETWARRASVSLSAYLRTSVEVTLSDIDQGMYSSLAQQLPERGIFYVISLAPLAGHFVLHMNIELAQMIADRLMGGPGTVSETDRRLTELETGLLRGTTEKLLYDLQEAWSNVVIIRPHVDDVSLNLMMVPIALPTDAIVWSSFEVRAKGSTSGMTLSMPYPVLKPIAGQLSPYTWVNNPETGLSGEKSQSRYDLEHQLSRLRLPITVQLGSAEVSLEEMASLRPGDVLPLDLPVDGLCPVLVNGFHKFLGRVGTINRKLAVRVAEVTDDSMGSAIVGELAKLKEVV
jgi:flagellar motor switch protein FliM